MEIDENIINEKALKLIDENVGYNLMYDASVDLKETELATTTLGIVRGILDMAEAMKGELKNETHHQGVSK